MQHIIYAPTNWTFWEIGILLLLGGHAIKNCYSTMSIAIKQSKLEDEEAKLPYPKYGIRESLSFTICDYVATAITFYSFMFVLNLGIFLAVNAIMNKYGSSLSFGFIVFASIVTTSGVFYPQTKDSNNFALKRLRDTQRRIDDYKLSKRRRRIENERNQLQLKEAKKELFALQKELADKSRKEKIRQGMVAFYKRQIQEKKLCILRANILRKYGDTPLLPYGSS